MSSLAMLSGECAALCQGGVVARWHTLHYSWQTPLILAGGSLYRWPWDPSRPRRTPRGPPNPCAIAVAFGTAALTRGRAAPESDAARAPRRRRVPDGAMGARNDRLQRRAGVRGPRGAPGPAWRPPACCSRAGRAWQPLQRAQHAGGVGWRRR